MRKKHGAEETEALDPIALTLAVWLGFIACVTGLAQMSSDAEALSAAGPPIAALPGTSSPVDRFRVFSEQLLAFGG